MTDTRTLTLSGLALALAVCPATADTDKEASTEDVYACASIETDTDRLACYDLAVGRLKQAEDAGEITTVSRREVEEVRKDSFGLSLPSLPALAMPKLGGARDGDDDSGKGDDGVNAGDELSTIESAVLRVDEDPFGKLIVTLENGQVWQQTGSRSVYVSSRGPQTAVVRRAALGSFMMKIGNGRSFRAKRLE